MSATEPTDVQLAEMQFRCDFCMVGPGEWCRSKSGKRAQYLHFHRWEAVMDVIKLSGFAAEEEHQRRLIIKLRQGISTIRVQGTRDVRAQCDELLRVY